jgi:hypothetical protein
MRGSPVAGLSGTWRQHSHSARAATGMLIQKIACQGPTSMSQPPRIGPSAAAMPEAAAQVPIARPRASGGK